MPFSFISQTALLILTEMNLGSNSTSGKALFDEGPNPENQPCHSPTTSSNTPPNPNKTSSNAPPNPTEALSKVMLSIYLPGYVDDHDVPENRVTRTNPNNGGYQFTTPPRANRSRRHSGPHLSPNAQLPTRVSVVWWGADSFGWGLNYPADVGTSSSYPPTLEPKKEK